ncbi:MAG: Pseudouridine synthase [Patescibacteria group bacterium]|nr:Pseudouridine synthase [Patescibacteria group bacterium]
MNPFPGSITEFSLHLSSRETRRIDTFLASQYPERSRSNIQRLIDKGFVKVNGQVIDKNKKVYAKDVIAIEWKSEPGKFEAEDIPLDIVFENADFAIINKDPFQNTHPVMGEGGNSGTLVNALLHHFGELSVIGGVERPGIVHRLDKDTSGIIVIAKNDRAMTSLHKSFHDRRIKKTYLALSLGAPKEDSGYIESYIGREPESRIRMTVTNPINPKIAKTEFTVLERGVEGKYGLFEVNLLTGRTHQIRVHLATIGHPILADKVYGNEKANRVAEESHGLSRQWLHAYSISFALFNKHYRFTAALKPDLLAFDPEGLAKYSKNTVEIHEFQP